MAERDRSGIAAMLAADSDLEPAPDGATALNAYAHKLAHAFAIDRDEWIGFQNAAGYVCAEKARGIVAADPVGSLGQIIRAERKKFGALRDLGRPQ